MAMMANKTKKLITFMPFRLRQPRQIGDEVEARVPTADTMPAPIPLALAGYSQQKQTWKKQKKKDTQPLKIKTTVISMKLYAHRSHSSGFTTKVSTNAHMPAARKRMMPINFLGIFQIKKKEGMKVTSSDRLTRQLLTKMSNPMSSMMSAGPQYMAYVMKLMMEQVMVMIRREGKRHRSIGVMQWSLKSQAIWLSITFCTSYQSSTLRIPVLMWPILFKARRVAFTPFLTRNWGVSSMYQISRTSYMMAGPVTSTIQLTLQLSISEKKSVMVIAPRVKKICTNTEYFCLFWSPTTSPKKKKQILMAASHPHPLKKSPTATMQILKLKATMTVPRVQMAHETTIDDFLPKLSEKKEMTIQPTKAPKQVQLETRSTSADFSHRQLSSVANEVKSESSGSMNESHWSSGSQQTQSAQRESERSRPCALQSKEQLRKRKAVLSRMMPVTNQQMRKISTIVSWYLPPSPARSMRWKQVVGGLPSALRRALLDYSRIDIKRIYYDIPLSNRGQRRQEKTKKHIFCPCPSPLFLYCACRAYPL